jgi:hypothetical protein
MNYKYILIILNLAFLTFGGMLEARQPYHGTITVGPDSAKVSEANIVNLVKDLRTTAIEDLIPIYTPTSAVSLDLNLRGLLANASFPANSNTLTLTLPNQGISVSFTGSTRDESIVLMKDFLKSNGNGNPKIFKAYAKFSPIDPIAGNPNSLMAMMAQSDYDFGRLSPLSGCNCCWSAQPIVHQFQAGVDVGRGLTKGFETTSITLPLRYSYSPDSSHAFIIDVPIKLNKYDGAFSLAESLGLGYRIPLTHQWSVTPTFRLGFGGSVDLAASGAFLATGFVSNFNYKIYDFVFSVTNQVTYFASLPLHLGAINYDYHLYNFVLKNGFALTSCCGIEFCGRRINYGLTFVDSDFQGDTLFIEHYDEVGVFLYTTCLNPCIDYDNLALGFVYQFGQKDYKGYILNMIYQF